MRTTALHLTLSALLLFGGGLSADDDASSERASALEAAKKKLTNHSYRLQYKFSPGEVVRNKVVHLVAIETTIRGVTETAKTRSKSTKTWRITDVDEKGNITFSYMIENANMWQQLSGRQELSYDSTKDDKPPAEYQHVADSIGVPMATVTIAPHGKIVGRKNARSQFNPGIGELTIPLPEQAVKVGAQWATPGELPVRVKPGMPVNRIKIRQLYTLKKVQTGVATIGVQTQILSPINDPAIQSQLVQRIKKGEIKFDVDAGRVLSQQMDIDETVIGFSGPDSIMKYLARLTEETLKEEKVAGKTDKSVK